MTITPGQDIIDSRDIIARIQELEDEREPLLDAVVQAQERTSDTEDGTEAEQMEAQNAIDAADAALGEWDAEYGDELESLHELQEQLSGESEWEHGLCLIADQYFEEYIRDMAADTYGKELRTAHWPFNCIDWDKAADEAKYDYSNVYWSGTEYWYRS